MLNWLWFLLALILFGFSAFTTSSTTECSSTDDACGIVEIEAWTPVTVDGHDGVVVPGGEVPAMLANFGLATQADDVWVPTAVELGVMEQDLERYMTRTTGLDPDMLDTTRQYGGFIENGKRKIFVNAFCAAFDDWKSEVIYVLDGGDCFWHAVYNVDTGTVELVWVNFSAEAIGGTGEQRRVR